MAATGKASQGFSNRVDLSFSMTFGANKSIFLFCLLTFILELKIEPCSMEPCIYSLGASH